MTKETNLEHYQKELEKIFNEGFLSPSDVFDKVKTNCDSNIRSCCWTTYARDILEWMAKPFKEPILNDTEREYLSAVIKPFRKKVKHIVKINLFGSPEEQFIRIVIDNLDFINLPNFNKNTGMYKGMEVDKLYSLEELGLWKTLKNIRIRL